MNDDTSQQPIALPSGADWSQWLRGRCDEQLDRAQQLAEQLRGFDSDSGLAALRIWNDIQLAISNTGAISGLLSQVHPDTAIQTQAEEADQRANRLATELGLDQQLYSVLAAIDPSALDAPATRMLRLTFAISNAPGSTATKLPAAGSQS